MLFDTQLLLFFIVILSLIVYYLQFFLCFFVYYVQFLAIWHQLTAKLQMFLISIIAKAFSVISNFC